jgi:hypothetical protein
MPNETHRVPLRYNISDFFSSLLVTRKLFQPKEEFRMTDRVRQGPPEMLATQVVEKPADLGKQTFSEFCTMNVTALR